MDISGKTPLINLLGYHIPVYKQTTDIKDDVMTIAVLLTQAGTDMNMTKCKAEYCNPLMMATHVKCDQLVRLFLEFGADVNVTCKYDITTGLRRVWRYQRGNQNPYIEEEQTTQWPKVKVQNDKQRSTKDTYKTKDRVTRTPLKPGVNSGAPEV